MSYPFERVAHKDLLHCWPSGSVMELFTVYVLLPHGQAVQSEASLYGVVLHCLCGGHLRLCPWSGSSEGGEGWHHHAAHHSEAGRDPDPAAFATPLFCAGRPCFGNFLRASSRLHASLYCVGPLRGCFRQVSTNVSHAMHLRGVCLTLVRLCARFQP